MASVNVENIVLVVQLVKNLPAIRETQARSLGWDDPLEKGMATHSNILPWRIPWTEEPGGLQSMRSPWTWSWLPRVGRDWATNTHTATPVNHGYCWKTTKVQIWVWIFPSGSLEVVPKFRYTHQVTRVSVTFLPMGLCYCKHSPIEYMVFFSRTINNIKKTKHIIQYLVDASLCKTEKAGILISYFKLTNITYFSILRCLPF